MIAHDHPRSPCAHWILLGLITFLTPGLVCADGWFLKIDGVPGQLTEGRFAGWTPVQSVGGLVRAAIDPTNGVAGPASFSCEVRKAFDAASPVLMQKCANGEYLRRVSLAYVLAQPLAAQYRITLDNALVSSVGHDGSGNSSETVENEAVKFIFDKIELAQFELDATGGTTGGLTAVFDQTTGGGQLKTRPPFRAIVTRQDGRAGLLVTWPAESGHRYQVLASAALGSRWTKLIEHTASDDGPVSQFVPTDTLALFMRVEEID
jgi:type VI protein secretion system component Hcp